MKVERQYLEWVNEHWDADRELVATRMEKYVEDRLSRVDTFRRRAARGVVAAAWATLVAAVVMALVYLAVLSGKQNLRYQQDIDAQTQRADACESEAKNVQRHVDDIIAACAGR